MRIRSNLNFPEEIYAYVGGHIHAINPYTGETVWQTRLPKAYKSSIGTVIVDGDIVLAGVGGYLHALDKMDGRLLWTNEFKSMGLGIVGIATRASSADGSAQAAQQQANAQAAAVAAAATAAAAGAAVS
ncbi:MAG: outer membrane protein assembly factor BamB family protein [Planctomycetota bacterium]|jgi:outer membrane protein assembly factor BamB